MFFKGKCSFKYTPRYLYEDFCSSSLSPSRTSLLLGSGSLQLSFFAVPNVLWMNIQLIVRWPACQTRIQDSNYLRRIRAAMKTRCVVRIHQHISGLKTAMQIPKIKWEQNGQLEKFPPELSKKKISQNPRWLRRDFSRCFNTCLLTMYNRLGELKKPKWFWAISWKIHINIPNTSSPKAVVRQTQSWSWNIF